MSDVKIILASGSQARTRMLSAAGVVHEMIASGIDETAVKERWTGRPEALARELARAKALMVSAQHEDALVIGSDQVLALGNKMLEKPGTKDNVRDHLTRLKGREHRLISAVAVAKGPDVLWDLVDIAHLSMRPFSDDFLDDYVERTGKDVAQSAGAYRIENLGAQLFDKVEGDFFTVMGMPLIPLLNFLRKQGALKA